MFCVGTFYGGQVQLATTYLSVVSGVQVLGQWNGGSLASSRPWWFFPLLPMVLVVERWELSIGKTGSSL